MSYRIFFFNESVQDEIQGWPKGVFASFLRITERIEISGPNLGMPYTRAFGNGLFEIRAKGPEGIGRAFFCCVAERQVIILHGFIKKTQKTPEKELRIARILGTSLFIVVRGLSTRRPERRNRSVHIVHEDFEHRSTQ